MSAQTLATGYGSPRLARIPLVVMRPTADLDDAALMRGLASGDLACLGRLVSRHQALALRVASHTLRCRSDAEDVVQEAFLRVLRAAPTYQPTASFKTWFYRIVSNLCLDERRRRPLRLVPLEPDESLVDPAPSPGLTAEGHELQARLEQALDRLPPRQRLAVVLLRFEGLSYAEIAHSLDCTEAAADSLLGRAFAQLRRDVFPEGAP